MAHAAALLALVLLAPDARSTTTTAHAAAPRTAVTTTARATARATTRDMAALPAGSYRPLYGRPAASAGSTSTTMNAAPDDGRVHVAAFSLDREPVTRGEFLAFVRRNPQWRRGATKALFAERGYLADWANDLDAGDATDLRRPVTAVSWFAAKAYCAEQGKRLPTVDEWEYAAAASERRADAAREPGFVRRLLSLYARRANGGVLPPVGSGFRNVYGVRDLHGLAWEWTHDFAGVLVSDDSRTQGSGGARTREHGLFCASAAIGATDPTNYPAFMRYAFRGGLTGRSTIRTLGFRCAADAAA